jgi:hypothetical protein
LYFFVAIVPAHAQGYEVLIGELLNNATQGMIQGIISRMPDMDIL